MSLYSHRPVITVIVLTGPNGVNTHLVYQHAIYRSNTRFGIARMGSLVMSVVKEKDNVKEAAPYLHVRVFTIRFPNFFLFMNR